MNASALTGSGATVCRHLRRRRLSGCRGAGLVAAAVLLFVFTAGGVIWLSRDVNERVAGSAAAHSVAFQSARAGAQQLNVDDLRSVAHPDIAPSRATAAAVQHGKALLDGLGYAGDVSATVDENTVAVQVTITSLGRPVLGYGSARFRQG